MKIYKNYNRNTTHKLHTNKFQSIVNQIAQQTGLEPRHYGNGFIMRCPAHNDNKASFTISKTQDDKILMHCFCGCTFNELCNSLNMSPQDFFSSKSENYYE